MVLFGLIGQVAWVVENMYLNVFIYKMFNASAADISLMVSASAVAATVTTILMGALSDRVGKRKIFICGGYLIWGITILGFALVRMDVLTPLCGSVAEAAALGVNLVILLDCAMTFFGSTANDAAYNAWLTEMGDDSSRGRIEGINAMMPLVAILVVFGGFMGFNLDLAGSWTVIYCIIGGIVLLIGVLGFFLIDEMPKQSRREISSDSASTEQYVGEDSAAGKSKVTESYWSNVIYSFRISTVKANKLLYAIVGAFALFGISIQIFMPYLIVYYEKSLAMSNYVLVLAPAIILAAVFTAVYGKYYDQLGFQMSIIPAIGILVAGYVILYFSVGTIPVFIGSLLMMCGYLSGMAVFGAVIRERIPEQMEGRFQGLRIIGQVLIPGVIGPAVGAWVLRDAAQIENQDGTFSFLPDKGIWSAATAAILVLAIALWAIFRMIRKGHYDLWTEAGERYRDGENTPEQKKTQACGRVVDTVQAERVTPWTQHPRPQMKREQYVVLHNNWKLNGKDITMPYPPQSLLSGYGQKVGKELSYETSFTVPENFTKERILLHFGAVDQIAEVWVNGQSVGTHEGGYLAFTFDITKVVKRDCENTLTVKVTDTLSRKYPYGKQSYKRGGMWYTPVSGIWQSVWLENVPEEYIESVEIKPDLEGIHIRVHVGGACEREGASACGAADSHDVTDVCDRNGEMVNEAGRLADTNDVANTGWAAKQIRKYGKGFRVQITLHNGEIFEQSLTGTEARIQLKGHIGQDGVAYEPRLWSCEDPYLYSMKIITECDQVESYFALRTISIQKKQGINRVCLNDKPIFLHGVLDQGYFPDGIYLPAEAEEYERDVLRMKELGFNFLRKHIKVEPEAFYYYCDKHGMLVMQDMVNSGSYSFIGDTALPTIGMKKRKDTSGLSGFRKEFFVKHTEDTIRQLYNHPCIIAYTIFNEGWGQFESDRMYDLVKGLDDSRLIDSTSGWFWQEKNDFDSEHIYFKVIDLDVKERPLFVSECGGYSRMVEGHHYSKYNTYGYGSAGDEAELTERIAEMYRGMILPGIPKGVCGCVYTQLSDVEDEVNGLYTYDRKVCKVEKERMKLIADEIRTAITQ